MAAKTEVYVDTSAFIAFADRSDTFHPLFRRLFANPPALLTTTLVVAECHGWFLRRFDRSRALQVVALLEELTPLRVSKVGPEEIRLGTQVLRRFGDQNLTLTDAVGLAAIERQTIAECWSTDFHLGLTGAKLAIHR